MTIWILALVLFALLAAFGYTLGVIRATFSLFGLLVGALLAGPLGHLMYPALKTVGVKNPVLVWLLGPVVVYLIVLILFKVVGLVVHRKVDVYYKYKAGDLRLALWNRLSKRLGLCVGLINAAAYLILISLAIYVTSYVTTQMVTGDDAATSIKLLNSAGRDLQTTGMAKITAAIDPTPDDFYQTADLVGLIYHNDLLESRLTRYPAFLSLGEQPEFQTIANDKAFTELRLRQPPITEILRQSDAQSIINNPDMLRQIWGIVQPNLQDLRQFLTTGQSAKYDDEKILGRWDANVNATLGLMKRAKPNITPLEMKRIKWLVASILEKTTMVAAPDKQVYLKNLGKLKLSTTPNNSAPAPAARPGRNGRLNPAAPGGLPGGAVTVDLQSHTGTWSADGARYQLSFPDKGIESLEAAIEGDRMTVSGGTLPIVFDREY